MHPLARHHHFRRELIPAGDRIARVEQIVIDKIITSDVPNSQRDSSIEFELKHSSGVLQCGRILAEKRGLDQDVAAAGAILHDIAVIVTGAYADHARRGERYVRQILELVGGFSTGDTTKVVEVVVNHSDKQLTSDDPYIEFGKDADILDCFLYPHAVEEYFLYKDLRVSRHYLNRAKKVWAELGLPCRLEFTMLDGLAAAPWMTFRERYDSDGIRSILVAASSSKTATPFAIRRLGTGYELVAPLAPIGKQSDLALDNSSEAMVSDIIDSEWTIFWPAISAYQKILPGTETYNLIGTE